MRESQRRPASEGDQYIGKVIPSPTEKAKELMFQAQELGRQHLGLTEQSMQKVVHNLDEIVTGGTIYSDGVKDRAMKLKDYIERELVALQNTQGWPVAPAAPAPHPA